MWVESTVGKGSTFHFLAHCGVRADDGDPVGGPSAAHARLPEDGPGEVSASDETRRSLRILLAEDNPVNQKLAIRFLEKWGHSVFAVADGHAVLRALQQERFDIVLMDVQMPGMDGLDAATAIRLEENAGGDHIPIVALTAHATERDRLICLEAGMDAYVTKPIVQRELKDTIDALATDAPTVGRVANPSCAPTATGCDVSAKRSFDWARWLAYLDGNEGLAREVAGLFLEDCPSRLASIQAALDAGDSCGLARAAHCVKSSLGNFQVEAAFQAASQLEEAGRRTDLELARQAWALLQHEVSCLNEALKKVIAEGALCDY